LAAGVAIVVALVKYVLIGGALERFLVQFESQGWFNARSYKANQGRLVRRLTMAGTLIVVITGVVALYDHKSLSGNWRVRLPYTEDLISEGHRLVATLLPDIRYTVPILLIALGLWIAWRAVNFPAFADFLIATEAELNKVSWVTRRRLVQDTIVVLVTLVLFAVFLLLIDQLWGWLLTRETLGGIVPKPVPKQTREAGRDLPW
jgi:preprotein translocase SecE subunit